MICYFYLMLKYKILLAFALGFALATGVGIYKQKKVASKANTQIATANTVISGLQDKQRELRDLRKQVSDLQLDNNLFRNKVSQLQYEISNFECPAQAAKECPQPKRTDGVFIMPSNFPITIGGNDYNCRAK